MKLRHSVAVCLLALVYLSGCKDDKADMSEKRLAAMAGGKLKSVTPVKGNVTIDGSPAEGVNLYLYRESDVNNPVAECRTNEDGEYCWTTNLNCDGLEAGKYLLGLTHIPQPKKNGTGVDTLKGKYKNPQTSNFKLTVEEGVEQEEVNYELVTK